MRLHSHRLSTSVYTQHAKLRGWYRELKEWFVWPSHQDGCPLALRTSPTRPVPASSTPSSQDWSSYILVPDPVGDCSNLYIRTILTFRSEHLIWTWYTKAHPYGAYDVISPWAIPNSRVWAWWPKIRSPVPPGGFTAEGRQESSGL